VTPPTRNPDVPRSAPGDGPRAGTPAPAARGKPEKKEKDDDEEKPGKGNRRPLERDRDPVSR
jgi:hypothetical protein